MTKFLEQLTASFIDGEFELFQVLGTRRSDFLKESMH